MFIEQAHEQLGWPSWDEMVRPHGGGARIIASLAAEKLGKAISRRFDGAGVEVGILASDAAATEPPLAIVCYFPKKVSEATLSETQKLAWNFGRSPLLITVEPHVIRKWTCCEPPAEARHTLLASPEIDPRIDLDPASGAFLSTRAAASLHWVELVSGEFFRRHQDRFRPEQRADQMLLANLRAVRQELIDLGLADDISHDLLARIIFIQFLFDRKDSDGRAALDSDELLRLHLQEIRNDRPVLSTPFSSFAEILTSYEDTYSLFEWLDSKFNGDLFPGEKASDGQDEQTAGLVNQEAWRIEREKVKPVHLECLARFINGQERMNDGQCSLWPYYAFDAIPLEFISSIYEEFVKKDPKTGVHYTPGHVADLILDSVLPWDGVEWDLRILDPACGSGVFLVKAFQRLIFRWKRAHPGEHISGDILSRMLENNLFGVDLDEHAVRVASFSLYLALCDEIDPRDYWHEVHFPALRGRRLIAKDFFSEDDSEFATKLERYDIVLGNPPWGKNTATELARQWSSPENHDWPISYGDIGPLFIAKGLALAKPGGIVGLLQPASTLLYNSTSAAERTRKRLFLEFQVDEVINFAAVRRGLFRDAIVPACAIIVRKANPTGEPFWYTCPKPQRTDADRYRIVIEPHDVHQIYPDEVQRIPWIWSALLWGGRRDVQFLLSLRRRPTLASLEATSLVKARQGIIRSKTSRVENSIIGRRMLRAADFPKNNSVYIRSDELTINNDPKVHARDSVDFSAFELPQLIIKQSWMEDQGRFRAAIIESGPDEKGIICSDSYLSVHADEDQRAYLEGACLAYNSIFAVYYLLLTSGRFAMDRNEPQTEAFRALPLPIVEAGWLGDDADVEGIDPKAKKAFGFREGEWLLVEDLVNYTLPDYKGGDDSPGRACTRRQIIGRKKVVDEPELTEYCNIVSRVLHAAYGADKQIGSVIYSEPNPFGEDRIPVRMVSIHLNQSELSGVRIVPMESQALQDRLTRLYLIMLSADDDRASFYQRCARTYDCQKNSTGGPSIVINIIKPDQVRYWTRSMALRDADEVAADLMVWQGTAPILDVRESVTCG